MKNSRKMLLGFAAVAAVIVAVVALNYPPVESPDAQGSIGAVQKYRDQQIKPADVVLGDEQGRKLEAALYGSLLEQATQLQSFSAELSGFSRTVDNREQLATFEQGLASRENDLAKSVLLAVADLQSKEQLASFAADLQSIARGFDNRSNLPVKELQSFEKSLDNMQQDLQAKIDLQLKELAAAQARLESSKQLDAREATLESLHADLGSLSAALESRDQIESKVLESRVLANRLDQLGARVLEQKAMYGLKQELAAIEKDLGSREKLGDRAVALDSKSAEFLGLATRLEARALDNMSSRLESRNLQDKAMVGIRQTVESFSQDLASRNLDSKVLGSMKNELQSFEQQLGSREAELNQKFAFGMKAELAAIGQHLENRNNLGAKVDMANRADMANKAEMANKSQLESRENLGSFNKYLGSLSQSLESRSELASRENALGVQAQELQNRAADLQSKSNF